MYYSGYLSLDTSSLSNCRQYINQQHMENEESAQTKEMNLLDAY